MENEECRKYSKNLLKKSKSVYKLLYHIVFVEICKWFWAFTKWLGNKKAFLHWALSYTIHGRMAKHCERYGQELPRFTFRGIV